MEHQAHLGTIDGWAARVDTSSAVPHFVVRPRLFLSDSGRLRQAQVSQQRRTYSSPMIDARSTLVRDVVRQIQRSKAWPDVSGHSGLWRAVGERGSVGVTRQGRARRTHHVMKRAYDPSVAPQHIGDAPEPACRHSAPDAAALRRNPATEPGPPRGMTRIAQKSSSPPSPDSATVTVRARFSTPGMSEWPRSRRTARRTSLVADRRWRACPCRRTFARSDPCQDAAPRPPRGQLRRIRGSRTGSRTFEPVAHHARSSARRSAMSRCPPTGTPREAYRRSTAASATASRS